MINFYNLINLFYIQLYNMADMSMTKIIEMSKGIYAVSGPSKH